MTTDEPSARRVAARIRIEQLHPDAQGRIPGDPIQPAPMWLVGDDVQLSISVNGKTLLSGTLEVLTMKAQLVEDGEVVRFHYAPTEWPEEG